MSASQNAESKHKSQLLEQKSNMSQSLNTSTISNNGAVQKKPEEAYF